MKQIKCQQEKDKIQIKLPSKSYPWVFNRTKNQKTSKSQITLR